MVIEFACYVNGAESAFLWFRFMSYLGAVAGTETKIMTTNYCYFTHSD